MSELLPGICAVRAVLRHGFPFCVDKPLTSFAYAVRYASCNRHHAVSCCSPVSAPLGTEHRSDIEARIGASCGSEPSERRDHQADKRAAGAIQAHRRDSAGTGADQTCAEEARRGMTATWTDED